MYELQSGEVAVSTIKFARPGRLVGPAAILEPLTQEHREKLRAISLKDQSIWTYFPINFNGAGEDFDLWFDASLTHYAKGEQFPFAIRRRADGEVVGTTRFYDLVPDHRRLAIGSTWYAPDARGTLLNPEVRLLSLTFAFTRLRVHRVELICDPYNLSSRSAMKLLGAVREGVIRNHMVYKDGRVRDSVLFSIIDSEWPAVQARLLLKLGYTVDMVSID
jgi:RimJ/RimL family protein N-acetyltransferase